MGPMCDPHQRKCAEAFSVPKSERLSRPHPHKDPTRTHGFWNPLVLLGGPGYSVST